MRSRVGTRRMRRHAFLELVMPPRVRRETDLDALAAELVPIFGHDLADAPPATSQQASALAAYNAWPRLARLAGFRTLVVSGAHDPIGSPKVGRSLAAAIADARYVEIEDAAHGLTVQQPERTNSLLRGHFAVAESARADARASRSALAG
jgi:pimeloyl-ACP methyl ester carboxylesterase